MTNEEAKVFLDNLKICIDEHPIVADWLVEIANRKTEPKICDTCRYYNSNIPCGSTPSACKEADKFAEEFVDGLKKLKPKDEPTTQKETQNSNLTFKTLEYCNICDHKGCEECISNALDEHCMPSQFKKQIEDECAKEYEELGLKELKELIEADRKTEPTISKMEQVDKDINVRSKDCTTCRHAGENYEDPCELCYRHSHYEPKDEPQTMVYPQVDGITPSVIVKDEPQKKCHRDEEYACHLYPNEGACSNCKLWFEDEPQTDCQWK